MKKDKEIKRFAKSKPLEKDELAHLKKWVAKQETKIDACEILEISRPTLDRLLNTGSARGNIIHKIKQFLTKELTTA